MKDKEIFMQLALGTINPIQLKDIIISTQNIEILRKAALYLSKISFSVNSTMTYLNKVDRVIWAFKNNRYTPTLLNTYVKLIYKINEVKVLKDALSATLIADGDDHEVTNMENEIKLHKKELADLHHHIYPGEPLDD